MIHNVGDFAIVAGVSTACLIVIGLVVSLVAYTFKEKK